MQTFSTAKIEKGYNRSESNKIATSDGHPSTERRFLFDFPPKFRIAGPLMRVKKAASRTGFYRKSQMLLHARRASLFCNTEKTENGHYPHNASWLSVACRGQLCLAKINTAQQLVCAQIPCILVNNDLPTRIYLATIRSYCFLQDSSKSLLKNYIWLKTANGVGNCALGILSAAL